MRKLFEQFQQHIEEFIEQRNDLLMLVACNEYDVAMVLAVLDTVEKANTTDLFLLFVNDFTNQKDYVSVIIEQLQKQHKEVCEALLKEGKMPLPPFPAPLRDITDPPNLHLRETMLFTRSLVPEEGDHRVVWAMCPPNITDRRAYLDLVSSLAPWKGIEPWMRGLRLIFREEANIKVRFPQLTQLSRVHFQEVDFGPEAIDKAWKDEVNDESLPEEQRMQALLSLAIKDYGYNRREEAIAKYNILLGYYQHTQNFEMQAFVINGLGDVYHRTNQLDKARYYYECALVPVTKVNSPMIFHTIVKNLGEVAFKQKVYNEAESFFDSANQLASALLDPESKVQDLEWRGLSQEKQKAYLRAIDSWEKAAALSRQIDLSEPLKRNLEHLARAYNQVGNRDKLATVKTELEKIKRKT